jgi:alpha-tubulin suppressor-like RCC1 family protein
MKVVMAAAGGGHTVVWLEDGRVLTFGFGVYGQLGHGGAEDERVPRVVEALAGMKVVMAAAGGGHTVVWLEDGRVFTFGNGESGQLGHGGEEDELVPRLVEGLAGMKVVGAAAGMSHTVVWLEDGRVLTFGDGADGRLGHGGQEDELVPRVVEGLAGMKVVGAAAGYAQTVVWLEDGKVLTFGDGSYGQLGYGGEEMKLMPHAVALEV